MINQINPMIQEQRSKILIKLSDKNQKEYYMNLIGKTVQVLFEEQDKESIKGHTANYIMIKVKEENINKFHNKIQEVLVTDVENNELIGKIIA